MTTVEFERDVFEILNEDCIYEILKRLSLDDLCRCSRTCKRLQALCGNYFRRKYVSKVNDEVKIRVRNGGKLGVYPLENYVKCFYNFIQNVTIIHKFQYISQKRKSKTYDTRLRTGQNEQSKITSIVNFVKSKCDPNLHKISIDGDIHFEWMSLCKEIENFLRNVEIVQLAHRRLQGHDEATFLKHCPNVKRLFLYDVSCKRIIDSIFQQQYQQLTHFFYIKGSPTKINAEKLKTFFKMNGKIQYVAWKFTLSVANGDIAVDPLVQFIQAHDYALNLEHLLLSVDEPILKNFNVICSQLKVLCDRDRFKTLELKFIYYDGGCALKSYVNQLADLKQLTKIHLTIMTLTDVIPALQLLSHLKIIVLSNLFHEDNWDSWYGFEELQTLVDNTQDMALPQIEEVQIEDMCTKRELTYIMQFARHWMNLERILVPSDEKYCYDLTFPIDELNRAREKLSNAHELTIFTNHKGNATNLNDGLVKLQFVEFERCCDSNPFQDYCIKV